jgi:hypothetical protein
MKHPDEDTLLKHVLDLLEGGERDELAVHLATCIPCRQRFDTMKRETEMLGGLETDIPLPEIDIPGRRRNWLPQLARIAALLLVGFASGYGFSQISRPQDVMVVPEYRTASAPPQTILNFTVCESLNLNVR